ncbi:MAG: hypothetical protein JNM18_24735 [Planctomycetaceae bacterium]|nr:hypothetical protein [Planctomycetaceae bacterium]
MSHQLLDPLQLFFGDANQAEARIYARLTLDDPHGCTLSGQITGPECEHAQTLPASFRLVDRGPGVSLLAESIVPDPCFWSPELPFLYRADVELKRGGEVFARGSRIIGLRPLGVRGKRLYWEGKNWVLRGVSRDLLADAPLSDWRENLTTMVVERPDATLLSEASRTGVAIVATCDSASVDPREELRRVSRFPAVVMFVVGAEQRPTRAWRQIAPNVILAQRCSREQHELGEATQVVFVDESSLGEAWLAPVTQAVVVCRAGGVESTVSAARAGCDRVQSDTAKWGEFAGYVSAKPQARGDTVGDGM